MPVSQRIRFPLVDSSFSLPSWERDKFPRLMSAGTEPTLIASASAGPQELMLEICS